MLLRDPVANQGLVGRFLDIAPILLHTGRSTQTPPPKPHEDWWVQCVDAELGNHTMGRPLALAGPYSAGPIMPQNIPKVHGDSPDDDWWAELVDNELQGHARLAGSTYAPIPRRDLVPVLTPPTPAAGELSMPPAPSLGSVSAPWATPEVRYTYERRRREVEGEPSAARRSARCILAGDSHDPAHIGDTAVHLESDSAGAAEDLTPAPVAIQRRLCAPLNTPLICGPPRLRRSRTPAPASFRRSERIAAAPWEADSTKQAQRVLMNKLGIATPSAAVGSDTVRKYKSAFRQPISDASHEAL